MRIKLRDPLTRNLILVGILVAGGLYAFFGTTWLTFFYQPTSAQILELRASYEKKSSDLARAQQAVADLARFQAEFAALHDRYELAAELLPQEREFPGMLRKITLAGQQAGVEFTMVTPSPPVVQGTYLELPMIITVRGGYHQFGQFLAQLANMRRIMNVTDIKMASQTSAENIYTMEATFTATAYMMNPAGDVSGESEDEES